MQQKQSDKIVVIKTAKGEERMPQSEYARWICLLEAVDLVSSKMKQLGHRLKNEDMDWIKPLAFQKYITERHESMMCELEIIDTEKDNFDFTCTTSPAHTLQLTRS